jgi:hypothetical protein
MTRAFFYFARVMRGKTGLLLIDTFERLFNQNECGHLEVGGRLLFVRGRRDVAFLTI